MVWGFRRFQGVSAVNVDAYLYRSEASTVAGVNPSTVAGWQARGWTTPAGERRHLATKPGRRGHLRYRLGDVLDAARDTAANPKSPGRESRLLVLG